MFLCRHCPDEKLARAIQSIESHDLDSPSFRHCPSNYEGIANSPTSPAIPCRCEIEALAEATFCRVSCAQGNEAAPIGHPAVASDDLADDRGADLTYQGRQYCMSKRRGCRRIHSTAQPCATMPCEVHAEGKQPMGRDTIHATAETCVTTGADWARVHGRSAVMSSKSQRGACIVARLYDDFESLTKLIREISRDKTPFLEGVAYVLTRCTWRLCASGPPGHCDESAP